MCAPISVATGGSYTTPGQFSAAAITNYFVSDAARYDYTVSAMNDYYLSILSMSDKGWPGGIRWLHGEDKDGGEPRSARTLGRDRSPLDAFDVPRP